MILAFLATNCASENSVLSNYNVQSNETDKIYSGTNVGEVIDELTLSKDQTDIDIKTQTDKDSILMLVSTFDNTNTTGSFEVSDRDSNNSSSDTPFLEKEKHITKTVHDLIRKQEQLIPYDEELPKIQTQKYLVNDSVKEFKVIKSFGDLNDYNIVTAEKIYETEFFIVYLDERNFEDVDLEEIKNTLDDFANVIPTERDFFGKESDVNGDGKFTILLSEEINKLGVQYGGIVTGFFYAIDLFDKVKYPASNEMEIFYILIPDPEGKYGTSVSENLLYDNILSGVLAHEYQHMINFNQRYFVNGYSNEKAWLNEALSHLAEDIYSINDLDFMEETGIENPSRISVFLNNINSTCMTCGTSLKQRGGSYLFLRFLYEKAEGGYFEKLQNGKSLLNGIIQNPNTGLKSLSDTLFGTTNLKELGKLYQNFAFTTFLSDTNYKSSDNLIDDFVIKGVDLRSIQNDNRYTYLNGPAIIKAKEFPYANSLRGYSITFIDLSDSLTGEFQLKISHPEQIKAFLIQ